MIQANIAATPASRTLTGRNALCPCGSGKKFKYCCLGMIVAPAAVSIPERLDEARRCFASDRLDQASSILHHVLALQPGHAEALHLLGLTAHRRGDVQGALALLHRAISADRSKASYFLNTGFVFSGIGEDEKAIQFFRHTLTLDPNSIEAHFNLGITLAKTRQFADAMQSVAAAIRLRPAFPEAINILGVALGHLGSHERALICYARALTHNPNYAPAHSNMGWSLWALGRFTDAVASLNRAIALDPRLGDAHVNLGEVLRGMGDHEGAIASCKRALELCAEDYDALLNLGNAYKDRGEYSLASEHYRRAIAANPGDARAHSNLAEGLRDLGRPAEAAEAYKAALAVQPNFGTAYSNLLYLHAFTRDITPAAELELARGWERAVLTEDERRQARAAAHPSSGVFAPLPQEGRRLRLGIVSAELGAHAVAEFLQPLLQNIDRERFHLTLFPTVGRWDARAEHLRSLADKCVSLAGVSDADAVAAIRREGIDVLMDTSGHTASNRLGIFARRAAPVQCSYIGYWSTTGLTEMDWFISDPDAPASSESCFSENLWRLPRIAVAYHGDHSLACDQWKPDPTGTIWIGSFNKYAKIREETLLLWAKVMKSLPESKLLLEDRGTHDGESQQRILDGLAANGICKCRVEFIPYVPGHERHMLLYNRLDIALDTIPFNSGTTAFDALWMGVPLVALDGDWIGGRMGASVLRTLGRRDWIANTHDEYAAIVRRLAHDVELRKRLRATQRAEMAKSQLADAMDLTSALESSFLGMYDHWLASH